MEYNTKTRMGIWLCLSMMLLVLAMVVAGVFDTASKTPDKQVSITESDEDAVYVNATPKPQETTSAPITEQTTEQSTVKTEATTASTERRALYYVALSGNKVVLLNGYGEYMDTLNENALFLPKGDLEALRAGIALYSADELSALRDDLS